MPSPQDPQTVETITNIAPLIPTIVELLAVYSPVIGVAYASASAVCSAIASVLPSSIAGSSRVALVYNTTMKVVDVVAFNVSKAKNHDRVIESHIDAHTAEAKDRYAR